MRKKLLSWLVVIAMVITMIPGQAFAATEVNMPGGNNETTTLTPSGSADAVAETSYIDADGTEKTVSAEAITADTVFTGGADKWYVVNSNVEINKRTESTGIINLILADGAKLSITGGFKASGLNVYRQTGNTGEFNVTSSKDYFGNDNDTAIYIDNDINIYGGKVIATSNYKDGICSWNGNIIVKGSAIVKGNGGSSGNGIIEVAADKAIEVYDNANVEGTSKFDMGGGIWSNGNLTITGGTVKGVGTGSIGVASENSSVNGNGKLTGISDTKYGIRNYNKGEVYDTANVVAESTNSIALYNNDIRLYGGTTDATSTNDIAVKCVNLQASNNAVLNAKGKTDGLCIKNKNMQITNKLTISDTASLILKGEKSALTIEDVNNGDHFVKNGGTINATGKLRFAAGLSVTNDDIYIPEGLALNDGRINDIDLYKTIGGEKFYQTVDFNRTITKKGGSEPINALTEYGTYVATFAPADGSSSPTYSKEFAIKTNVNNIGTNTTVEYNGNTIDVKNMFNLDPKAGTPTYSVTNGTGTATIDGSLVTVTKVGDINVKVTTAESDAAYSGQATAVLTVTKGTGKSSVSIDGWTFGETANKPVPTSETNGTSNVTYLYESTDGKGYKKNVAPTNAGAYKVTATFAETDLYKETTAVAAFNIDKADSVVTDSPVAKDITYTGLAQDLVTIGTATGGTMQYSLKADTGFAAEIPQAKNADKYTVYYKVAGDANHNDSKVSSVEVTIKQKPLTITAENKTVKYGASAPEYTVKYDGFVSGEDEKNLDGKLAFECTYTNKSDAKTTHVITPKGLTSTNYKISFVGGTLTVEKADVTATMFDATNVKFTYDGQEHQPTVTAKTEFTGVGEVAVTTKATKVIDSTDAIEFTVAEGSNYNAGTLTIAKPFTITPKTLTIDVKVADKYWDGQKTATITSAELQGIVDKDEVKLVNAKAEFASENVGKDIDVTVSGYSLEGKDAANYSVDKTVTAKASISHRPLPPEPERPAEPEVVKPEVPKAPETGAEIGMNEVQQEQADTVIGNVIGEIVNPERPESPAPQTEAEKETAKTEEAIQQAVKDKEQVKVNVETSKVDENSATPEVKEEISQIKNAVTSAPAQTASKILQFLNIDVTAQAIDKDGNVRDLGNLRNLGQKLTFTIQLPADTVGNYFGVVRYHDGKADFVPLTDIRYNAKTKTIEFDTDRFSTYAVYEYEPVEVTPEPEKLDTVQNVNVDTDNGLLKVTFDKVTNADNYKIYVQQDDKGWRWYRTKNNSLVIKKLYKEALVKNGKYQVKVVALNERAQSEDSQIVTVYANRIGTKSAVMYAPKFTSVKQTKGTLNVVAKKVYTKNTPKNLQYKVSYKLKGTSKWNSAGYGAKNVKSIKGLKKGKVYNLALRYRYQSSLDGKTKVYSKVVYKNVKIK